MPPTNSFNKYVLSSHVNSAPMEKTVQKRQNLYPPGVYGYSKLCSSESHTLNALGLTLGSQGGKQIYYSCPTLILRGRDLKSLCFLSCFMCLIIPPQDYEQEISCMRYSSSPSLEGLMLKLKLQYFGHT